MSIQRNSIPTNYPALTKEANNDQFTEQFTLEKIGIFLERVFQNDPAQATYKQEWESFQNLIKVKPVDMDKVSAFLSKLQSVSYVSSPTTKLPTYGRVSYDQKYMSSVNAPSVQASKNDIQSAKPNLTDKTNRSSYNTSSDLASANSYIPRINKAALLEKFDKLKLKMNQHSDRLIKAAQRHDGTSKEAYKFEDRTPLRRVALYTKDQNQKNDIFKEIENKLTDINDGNYNNYRFFN